MEVLDIIKTALMNYVNDSAGEGTEEANEIDKAYESIEAVLTMIGQINWSLLSEQKESLAKIIGGESPAIKHYDHLEGILHLIDSIQDSAVDELGIDGDKVFPNLED